MSKKAGVMIDDWKLPVFKRILDDAGYVYEQLPGLTKNTINLMVQYEFVSELQPYIEKAQNECRKKKKCLKKKKHA